MTNKETTTDVSATNKLIAEFMGEEVRNDYTVKYLAYNRCLLNPQGTSLFPMEYHKNWQWLILVIEKIEKDGNTILLDGTRCHIDSNDGEYSETNCMMMNNRFETDKEEETKLESAYLAITEFIEWYNEKKVQK